MAGPQDDEEIQRNRRTMLLILGGAASLLLPLLGVVWIKVSESLREPAAQSGSQVFTRRGVDPGSNIKIIPAATAVAVSPPPAAAAAAAAPAALSAAPTASSGGSGLGMVVGDSTYYQDKAA